MRLLLFLLLLSATITAQDTTVINIDFGSVPSAGNWNNVSRVNDGRVDDLITSEGRSSGLSILVYDAFGGINNSGTTMPDPGLDLPSTATEDSFFGSRDSFSNRREVTGGVLLEGLNPNKAYNLTLFASRLAGDNRETQYSVTGAGQSSHFLDVADNTNRSVIITDLRPSSNGNLLIQATTGPNNTNDFGFFYLGALRLSYEGQALGGPQEMSLLYPNGEEYWEIGKEPEIRWESKNIQDIFIEYSPDGGENWNIVDIVDARLNALPWTVPNTPSDNALIRMASDSLRIQSASSFAIAESEADDCHIVILGSSTAAGTGPTVRDSAWVWMYRDVLFQCDTRFRVTNLARGGFTTYNILPSGSAIPGNVSQSIDTARNVTKALSLEPDAIIINLPSNDAANAYPVADQLSNYAAIVEVLKPDSIPVWVCTPQPRNFSESRRDIQLELIDSTYAVFGERTIDFWTGLNTPDNGVSIEFDSGDGVHLNNAGHRILLDRVLEARIDSVLLADKGLITGVMQIDRALPHLSLHTNPVNDYLQTLLPQGLELRQLVISDSSGRMIPHPQFELRPGTSGIELGVNTSRLIKGHYTLRVIGHLNGKPWGAVANFIKG